MRLRWPGCCQSYILDHICTENRPVHNDADDLSAWRALYYGLWRSLRWKFLFNDTPTRRRLRNYTYLSGLGNPYHRPPQLVSVHPSMMLS